MVVTRRFRLAAAEFLALSPASKMRIAIIERLLSRSENQMGDNWVVVFGESSGRGDTRQGRDYFRVHSRRVFARAAL